MVTQKFPISPMKETFYAKNCFLDAKESVKFNILEVIPIFCLDLLTTCLVLYINKKFNLKLIKFRVAKLNLFKLILLRISIIPVIF